MLDGLAGVLLNLKKNEKEREKMKIQPVALLNGAGSGSGGWASGRYLTITTDTWSLPTLNSCWNLTFLHLILLNGLSFIGVFKIVL